IGDGGCSTRAAGALRNAEGGEPECDTGTGLRLHEQSDPVIAVGVDADEIAHGRGDGVPGVPRRELYLDAGDKGVLLFRKVGVEADCGGVALPRESGAVPEQIVGGGIEVAAVEIDRGVALENGSLVIVGEDGGGERQRESQGRSTTSE